MSIDLVNKTKPIIKTSQTNRNHKDTDGRHRAAGLSAPLIPAAAPGSDATHRPGLPPGLGRDYGTDQAAHSSSGVMSG